MSFPPVPSPKPATWQYGFVNGVSTATYNGNVITSGGGSIIVVPDTATLAALPLSGIACVNGAEFVATTGDYSSWVTDDPYKILFVAPDSDPTGANGAWVRTLYGAVLFAWWNAPVHGSGLTAEGQLDSAITLSSALQVPLFVDGKIYDLECINSLTEFGATRYYALHPRNNMDIIGVVGQTTFRIADGQSTNAAPKDCNIFTGNVVFNNNGLSRIIFNLNSTNNVLGAGATQAWAAYQITGNSGTINGLWITQCEFNDGPGESVIVCAQQTIDTVLSNNINIWGNSLHNNGQQVADHASIYLWASNCWVYNNTFTQDDALSPIGFNWVCWENHGPHQYCYNNTAYNYVKLTNTATNWNQSEGVHDIHIYHNNITTYYNGPNFFVGGSGTVSALYDVFCYNNNIGLKPGLAVAGPVGIFVEFQGNPGGMRDIYCSDNNIFALATSGYAGPVYGGQITAPANCSITRFFWKNNKVTGTGYGFYARVNNGDGTLDQIVEEGNIYTNLINALSTGIAFGSVYSQAGTSVLGSIRCRNNTYRAGTSVTFDWGILLSGTIGEFDCDDNTFDGMTNYNFSDISIDNAATLITTRKGRQICTGSAPPANGTWKLGQWFYNGAPSATGIPYWVNTAAGSPGTWTPAPAL